EGATNVVSSLQQQYNDLTSCAVVGNSGTLRGGSRMGLHIDHHDIIFRVNQAPTESDGGFTGDRTIVRMLSPTWVKHYARLDVKRPYSGVLTHHPTEQQSHARHHDLAAAEEAWLSRMPGATSKAGTATLPLEHASILVCALNSNSRGTVHEDCNHLRSVLRKERPDVRVLQLAAPVETLMRRLIKGWRARLCAAGRGPYRGGDHASTGLQAVYLAVQLCQRVDIYGFGPNPSTSNAHRASAYHYFSGLGSRHVPESFFSWEVEQELLHAMALEGHLVWNRANGTVSKPKENVF
ncbi:hypothetical protein CYMTET_50658, partial [Cymbomonas tetramitiformis]